MIEYIRGFAESSSRFLDFVFFPVGTLILAGLVITVAGFMLLFGWAVIGYFVLLALISPESAESVLKEIGKELEVIHS